MWPHTPFPVTPSPTKNDKFGPRSHFCSPAFLKIFFPRQKFFPGTLLSLADDDAPGPAAAAATAAVDIVVVVVAADDVVVVVVSVVVAADAFVVNELEDGFNCSRDANAIFSRFRRSSSSSSFSSSSSSSSSRPLGD